MTTRQDRSVSRRDAVVRLGAGGLGLALAARGVSAAAQEATPLTETVGVVGDILGAGQPTSTPEMELVLRRTTIAPGGGIPPHSHPGSIVIVVDAGTWGYTPLGGTIQLTRAAVNGTPAPAEEVPLGTEVILTKGDALFVEDPQDDIRNVGEDDVVLLIAALTPVGEDFQTLLGDEEGATPEG
jgi:quercetin dioxygenase-like cupin family protein